MYNKRTLRSVPIREICPVPYLHVNGSCAVGLWLRGSQPSIKFTTLWIRKHDASLLYPRRHLSYMYIASLLGQREIVVLHTTVTTQGLCSCCHDHGIRINQASASRTDHFQTGRSPHRETRDFHFHIFNLIHLLPLLPSNAF